MDLETPVPCIPTSCVHEIVQLQLVVHLHDTCIYVWKRHNTRINTLPFVSKYLSLGAITQGAVQCGIGTLVPFYLPSNVHVLTWMPLYVATTQTWTHLHPPT